MDVVGAVVVAVVVPVVVVVEVVVVAVGVAVGRAGVIPERLRAAVVVEYGGTATVVV